MEPIEANESDQLRDLQRRYRHHKARHEFYKKRYLKERKIKRWLVYSLAALAIVTTTAAYLSQSLSRSAAEAKYQDLLAVSKLQKADLEEQGEIIALLKQELMLSRRDSNPKLALFEQGKLIVQEDTNIKSILFQESTEMGSPGVKFQILVTNASSEPYQPQFVIEFFNVAGEPVSTFDSTSRSHAESWVVGPHSTITIGDTISSIGEQTPIVYFALRRIDGGAPAQ
jgi:hypothetical protein